MTEYFNLQRRPGQTLGQLASKVSRLVEEIYPKFAKSNKADIMRNRFLNSLDSHLRVGLSNQQRNLKTLADVKNAAIAFKSSSKQGSNKWRSQPNKPSSKKWCPRCRSNSHNESMSVHQYCRNGY